PRINPTLELLEVERTHEKDAEAEDDVHHRRHVDFDGIVGLFTDIATTAHNVLLTPSSSCRPPDGRRRLRPCRCRPSRTCSSRAGPGRTGPTGPPGSGPSTRTPGGSSDPCRAWRRLPSSGSRPASRAPSSPCP